VKRITAKMLESQLREAWLERREEENVEEARRAGINWMMKMYDEKKDNAALRRVVELLREVIKSALEEVDEKIQGRLYLIDLSWFVGLRKNLAKALEPPNEISVPKEEKP